MGYWQDGEWHWRLECLDSLMPAEVIEAESLEELLVDVQSVRERKIHANEFRIRRAYFQCAPHIHFSKICL
jgi:hypothetical protein